eukprot:29838_6
MTDSVGTALPNTHSGNCSSGCFMRSCMPVWLAPWSSVALASEPVVSSQLIVTLYFRTSGVKQMVTRLVESA